MQVRLELLEVVILNNTMPTKRPSGAREAEQESTIWNSGITSALPSVTMMTC